MGARKQTTNHAIPVKRSHASQPARPVLEVGEQQDIAPRRFTKADLLAVDRELRAGPFDKVEWTIEDEQGKHIAQNISSILSRVLWDTVKTFQVSSSRHFKERSSGYQVPMNYLHVGLWGGLTVTWSSAPEHRQPVELAYKKVFRFLDALPKQRGHRCAFVDGAITNPVQVPRREETTQGQMAQERPWWDPRRPPRSIYDWLAIAVISGIVVGMALAFIFVFVAF